MSEVAEEPAWRRRAVERSTRAAKLRAEQRVQRFLDAAQELMAEKGTTDFTVQEVVDRSKQSLRSFYQHFDGKHELLLALFEDALVVGAAEVRKAAEERRGPLPRLQAAVETLYGQCCPPGVRRPLFSDFALQLLVTHPPQVAAAHRPMLDVFTELVEDAAAAGVLRSGRPRRQAALVMQTVIFSAHSSGGTGGPAGPVTAPEIWQFCLRGISAGGE
ncbi:TetR family transcriptional regulator [Actinomadura sp. CNU-125]|uniref:TetR/AcrR family transcriptional regulator n=1 Tax=Actinomadura sp. CNU-125 TaxID=1904961 RepID=UPI000961164C|nr:TetR/AcrR family transcriptional regulator [Actinomadura sp. CNU-125]OLT26938.1 TetR family transcriptional regulator [Actinomadura sp. CNU-125]